MNVSQTTTDNTLTLGQQLKDDTMTLEEKLAAIDAAMAAAQSQADDDAKASDGSSISAPVDPADLTMCLGCQ